MSDTEFCILCKGSSETPQKYLYITSLDVLLFSQFSYRKLSVIGKIMGIKYWLTASGRQ